MKTRRWRSRWQARHNFATLRGADRAIVAVLAPSLAKAGIQVLTETFGEDERLRIYNDAWERYYATHPEAEPVL